jgi:hypothetical protein
MKQSEIRSTVTLESLTPEQQGIAVQYMALNRAGKRKVKAQAIKKRREEVKAQAVKDRAKHVKWLRRPSGPLAEAFPAGTFPAPAHAPGDE